MSKHTHVPYTHMLQQYDAICGEAVAAVPRCRLPHWSRAQKGPRNCLRRSTVHKGSELTETIPYHPWDCFIYLHGWLIFMVNVGKCNIHGWYGHDNLGTPWKIDMVHLQISHLERKMIFQTSMIMFKPLIFRGVTKRITVQLAKLYFRSLESKISRN